MPLVRKWESGCHIGRAEDSTSCEGKSIKTWQGVSDEFSRNLPASAWDSSISSPARVTFAVSCVPACCGPVEDHLLSSGVGVVRKVRAVSHVSLSQDCGPRRSQPDTRRGIGQFQIWQ